VTASPTAVVNEFLTAWNANDLRRVVACLHPEVVYHNIPVAAIHGRDEVYRYLTAQGVFDWVNWKVLAIAASGNKVLTERVDDFSRGGIEISLPLMGIFEIEEGLIKAWRDYFDMGMYRRQLEGSKG